jgi:hypothetical protein
MNEIFRPIKERELRRFHQAIDTVTDALLSTNQPKTVRFVKNNLEIIDFLTDEFFELFDLPAATPAAQAGKPVEQSEMKRISEARANWDIFASGVRWINQRMPDSYLFKFVLPMFKLEDLEGKILSYSGQWLEQTHISAKALSEVDKYLRNYEKGEEIVERYSTSNQELVRLYASLKTWETKEKFEKFFKDFDDFLSTSVEVFILGPIQLYLMISRESFLLIFKALSIGKISELEEQKREKYQEIMAFNDWFYGLIEKSQTLRVFQDAIKSTVKEYVRLLREEEENIRKQLPTKDLKNRLIERFEKGLLFQEED